MDINEDFADVVASLVAEGVEFLIVGAYALAAHGFPRMTGDIDIFVRPTPENAERVSTRQTPKRSKVNLARLPCDSSERRLLFETSALQGALRISSTLIFSRETTEGNWGRATPEA